MLNPPCSMFLLNLTSFLICGSRIHPGSSLYLCCQIQFHNKGRSLPYHQKILIYSAHKLWKDAMQSFILPPHRSFGHTALHSSEKLVICSITWTYSCVTETGSTFSPDYRWSQIAVPVGSPDDYWKGSTPLQYQKGNSLSENAIWLKSSRSPHPL